MDRRRAQFSGQSPYFTDGPWQVVLLQCLIWLLRSVRLQSLYEQLDQLVHSVHVLGGLDVVVGTSGILEVLAAGVKSVKDVKASPDLPS